MGKKPFALVAVLLAVALGLFLLWRALEGNPAQPAPARADVAEEARGSETPASGTSLLETPADATGEAARAAAGLDKSAAAAELAARTETFPLQGALWIEGSVRVPKDSPPDETLQVWAFEDAASRGLRGSEDDLPALVREGRLQQGWWSHRPLEAGDRFRIPLPNDAKSACILLDGRFLFLEEVLHLDVPGRKEPLALAPALGAWLVGTCIPPPGAAPEDTPTGAPVEFFGFPNSTEGRRWKGPSLVRRRTDTVGADSSFELRGLPVDFRSQIDVRPERLMNAHAAELALIAGKKYECRLEFQLGGRAIGRVIDEAGSGLASTRVRFRQEMRFGIGSWSGGSSGRDSTTAADGDFEVFGIPPGKTHLTVELDGYVPGQSDEFVLKDGETRSGISLVLFRGNRVGGTVTWPDGSPAAGASVVATVKVAPDPDTGGRTRVHTDGGTYERSSKTGAQGEFSISGLGSGPFTLSATAHRALEVAAGGQANAPGENLPQWSAVLPGVAAGSTDVVLALKAPVGLGGRVVDDLGSPVKKFGINAHPSSDALEMGELAHNVAWKSQTFESEDGSFLLTGLQAGKWNLEAEADGYVKSEDDLEVEVPRKEPPLLIQLARAGSASGVVLDPDGRPTASAEVVGNTGTGGFFSPQDDHGSAETDPKGAFHLKNLPVGSVALTADAKGFAKSEPWPVQIAAGQTIEGVVLRLRRGGRLTGEVFDERGGHAAGRNVQVMSMTAQEMRQVRVDALGQFAVDNLTPGTYQVIVEPAQAEAEEMARKAADGGDMDIAEVFSKIKMTSAEIKENETTHVVLGAPPKAPVRVFGRVTQAGEPVRTGMIVCVGEGGSLLSKLKMGKVRESGDYELSLDEPGDVVLSYQREMGLGGGMEFHATIPEEKEHRVDIELPTGGLRGVVRGPDGAPVENVAVDLLRSGGLSPLGMMDGGEGVSTDERGRFEFQGLHPGTYAVAAGGAGNGPGNFGDESEVAWGRVVKTGLVVEKDKVLEGVELQLSAAGRITGIVRGADGQPLAGATVFVRDERGEVLHRFSGVATDANGRFTYRGVSAGRYTLCARTKTLASPETAPIPVRAGEAAEVELAVGPGTMLRVSVEDKSDKTLHASFSVRDEHGHEVGELFGMESMESLFSEGISSTEQRIGPLPPGEYKVTATAFDGRSASKPVKVRGQEERALKLRVE